MAQGFGGDSNEGNSWDPNNLGSEWQRLQKSKAENEKLMASFQHPQTGYGGFSYTPSSAGVLPKGLGYGYGQAAGYILGGSQGAAEQTRLKYESMLRARTGGIGMAYGNQMQRGGNALAGQGISPILQQLLMHGQRSNALGQMASGAGEAESEYHGTLADLAKGTGTELAGLKTSELGSTLNYLVGRDSSNAAKSGQGLESIAGIASLAKLFMG